LVHHGEKGTSDDATDHTKQVTYELIGEGDDADDLEEFFDADLDMLDCGRGNDSGCGVYEGISSCSIEDLPADDDSDANDLEEILN
jgi:hypothetical protein